MAEIKIEKKKPIWPWIVVLLIISALIYFVFSKNNEVTSIETQNTTVTDTIAH